MPNYSKEVSVAYSFNGNNDDCVYRVSSLFQIPDGQPQKDKNTVDHTLRFIKTNCTSLNTFIERLNSEPPSVAIVNLTKQIHAEDMRKMTGEMYIKHLFYTAYLVDEMTSEKKYTPNQRELITAVALLHDTIELKRKKKATSTYDTADFYKLLTTSEIEDSVALKDWNKRDIKKIVTMVSLMTPPDKSIETPADEWRKIKSDDFYFLLNITKKEVKERAEMLGNIDGIIFNENEFEEMAQIIKDVKIAEVLANLRETADDIVWSRDGHKDPNMRDFNERYSMFEERTDYFRSTIPLNKLYLTQMEEDMQILHDFIRS